MYKKSFTFTITFNEFHAFLGLVLIIHLALMNSKLKYNLAPGNHLVYSKAKEVNPEEVEQKFAVRLGSRLSKNTRVSRFKRYLKGVKGIETSQKIIDESLFEGELTKAEESAMSKLSQAEIDKIINFQQENYQEDAKGVRKILEKNQKSYQACYEKALLKDQLLNGVGRLVILINAGQVTKVESLFRGDGHKIAVNTLTDCLDSKSKRLKVTPIKGKHKVKFNLVFKS